MITKTPRIFPGFHLVTLILLLLAGIIPAACTSVEAELIDTGPQDTRIERLTGTEISDVPIDERFSGISRESVEKSLHRITVRFSKWASFVRGEPEPLLHPLQIRWLAPKLAPLLQNIKPNQRIRLRFPDRRKFQRVTVDIYPEGHYLVYLFRELSVDPQLVFSEHERKPVFYAQIEPQPGQKYEELFNAVVVKARIYRVDGESDEFLLEKIAMVEKALENGLIEMAEGKTLKEMAGEKPEILVEDWADYWEKRETLLKAREQKLFTEAEYRQRITALTVSLMPDP